MRIYVYLALTVVLLAGLKWAHGSVYDAGYGAAVLIQQEAIREAKDDAVKAARLEWEATAVIAEETIIVEEKIIEVVRTIEKEIPIIVEKIVTVHPECRDLGDDFARLLNNQVSAGANRPDGGADIAPESDAALSTDAGVF